MQNILFNILMYLWPVFGFAEMRHASPHMHGVNVAQIVVDGKQLSIRYQMPIIQLIEMHEHEKHEHEEHEHEKHEHEKHEHEKKRTNAKLNMRLISLRDSAGIFSLSPEAKCNLEEYNTEIRAVVSNEQNEPDGGHKDIFLSYEYNCAKPKQLSEIYFNGFSYFNELQNVEIEALINGQALVIELTKGNPALTW